MKSYQALKKQVKHHGGQCSNCPSVKNITVDHIIPGAFLIAMGLPQALKEGENLQLLCEPCNRAKGGQLDFSHPKTVKLLRYFTEVAILKHTRPTTRKITARCQCHPEPTARETWRKMPGLAPSFKPDVIRSKDDVDRSNW